MQTTLLVVVMVSACMVLSDGILTPSISVISAIEGLQFNTGISKGVLCMLWHVVIKRHVWLAGVQWSAHGRVSSLAAFGVLREVLLQRNSGSRAAVASCVLPLASCLVAKRGE